MPLMAIAVTIQFALALANLAVAIMLSRRLRRIAGLEQALQEIRHRLRRNARSLQSKTAGPADAPQPRTQPDPTLGFRDPAR